MGDQDTSEKLCIHHVFCHRQCAPFLSSQTAGKKPGRAKKRDPAPQSGLRGIGSNKNTVNILAEK
ncbi:hypothetical protein B4096_0157 [Heyndrickxia coagulans]|nr:hypothetical protein B4096_0157 [Heyndrickxia coagulans]